MLGRGQAPVSRSLYCESLTPTRYGANALRGLVGERWKFIQTTRPELYDLYRDPGESNNLAMVQEAVATEQSRALGGLLNDRGDSPAKSTPAGIDQETVRRLAALGYASSPVNTTVEVVPTGPDPKDLIAVHVAHTHAVQLIATNNCAVAEPLSRQVLEALPDSWEANLTLGKVAVGLGHWAEAASLFERSLELKPTQPEALRGLGEALSGLGRLQAATEVFLRALPLDPEPPRVALRLARTLWRQGRSEEAQTYMVQAARQAGGRPIALKELARLLAEQGRSDEAVSFLKKALQRARIVGDTAAVTSLQSGLAELQGHS